MGFTLSCDIQKEPYFLCHKSKSNPLKADLVLVRNKTVNNIHKKIALLEDFIYGHVININILFRNLIKKIFCTATNSPYESDF